MFLPRFLTIEKGLGPEGRVAVVRFDRGDGINALSPEALRQLTDAARSFEDDGGTSNGNCDMISRKGSLAMPTTAATARPRSLAAPLRSISNSVRPA